ncbi:hypothetical protein REPUB_Repub08aG0013300 [Reevesia pubescens]
MIPRWSRTLTHLSKLRSLNSIELGKDFSMIHRQSYAAVAQVNLDKMFWSKPCSLALAPDSPLRVEDPKYEGIKLYYSQDDALL